MGAGRKRTGVLSTIARSWERALAPPDRFNDTLKEAVSGKLADLRDAGEQEENAASTVFEAEWHLTRPFVDLAPFHYLAERFEPRTVLDVGCGLGAILLYFQSRGAEKIVGVDGFPARYSLLEEARS